MHPLDRTEFKFIVDLVTRLGFDYLSDRSVVLRHLDSSVVAHIGVRTAPIPQLREDIVQVSALGEHSGSHRALYEFLTNLRETLEARLGGDDARAFDQIIDRLADRAEKVRAASGAQPIREDYIDLPYHIVPRLVGRQRDLDSLSEAWNHGCNVVGLIGPGGAGKTSVVFALCEQFRRLRANLYVEGIFAWTFYRHVATLHQETAVDDFAEKALEWLGLADRSELSLATKFAMIGDALRGRRCLMVLDGVETLIGSDPECRFVQLDMRRFLSELCTENRGLCVLTSRLPLCDLRRYGPRDGGARLPAYLELPLRELTGSSGVGLLRQLGVAGTDEALLDIARECQGHALTLHLLGHYLTLENRDASTWKELFPFGEKLIAGEDDHSRQTRSIMKAYARRFDDGAENELLEVLSLFSTAVPIDLLDRLRGKPSFEAEALGRDPLPSGPVPGLTDRISWQRMNRHAWVALLQRLHDRGLISLSRSSARYGKDAETIVCHLAVRAFYAERLKQRPAAWRAGHAWIYRYISAKAPEQPDNVEDMAFLLSAVPHACQAGFAQEVMTQMMHRSCRGTEYYINRILGIPGTALQALSHVFLDDWSTLRYELPPPMRGRAYWFAGYVLMATGRLKAAYVPFRHAFTIWSQLAHDGSQIAWLDAAMAASDLSEVLLNLGELSEAAQWAATAVEHARGAPRPIVLDSYGHDRVRIAYTVLGTVSHLRGQQSEAHANFAEAVDYSERGRASSDDLRSLQGYRYHDFLLSLGRVDEVAALIEHASTCGAGRGASLLARGLERLMEARVRGRLRSPAERGAVLAIYEDACERLRRAGRAEYLALGLIALSAYVVRHASSADDLERADRDLEAALDIARYGGMRLREMQALLVRSRLELCRAERYTEGEVSLEQLNRIEHRLDRLAKLTREIGHAHRQEEAAELAARLTALREEWERSRNARDGAACLFLRDKVRFIYIPGFLSTSSSPRTTAMRALFHELGDRCEVIAPVGADGRQRLISTLLGKVREVIAQSNAPYFLVGSSLGGYVAALAGSELLGVTGREVGTPPRRRRQGDGAELLGVLMLSPSFGIGRRWLEEADPQERRRWMSQGSIKWRYGGAELDVPYEFVGDALSHAEFPTLDTVPAMVIHGVDDDVVPVEVCRDYTSETESVVLHELACGHSLEPMLGEVVRLARGFFTQALTDERTGK